MPPPFVPELRSGPALGILQALNVDGNEQDLGMVLHTTIPQTTMENEAAVVTSSELTSSTNADRVASAGDAQGSSLQALFASMLGHSPGYLMASIACAAVLCMSCVLCVLGRRARQGYHRSAGPRYTRPGGHWAPTSRFARRDAQNRRWSLRAADTSDDDDEDGDDQDGDRHADDDRDGGDGARERCGRLGEGDLDHRRQARESPQESLPAVYKTAHGACTLPVPLAGVRTTAALVDAVAHVGAAKIDAAITSARIRVHVVRHGQRPCKITPSPSMSIENLCRNASSFVVTPALHTGCTGDSEMETDIHRSPPQLT